MREMQSNHEDKIPQELRNYFSNSPYEVLNVSPTASGEEITGAWRNAQKKFHPDINKGYLPQGKPWTRFELAKLALVHCRAVGYSTLYFRHSTRKSKSKAFALRSLRLEINTDSQLRYHKILILLMKDLMIQQQGTK